jgi:hypothetical protein
MVIGSHADHPLKTHAFVTRTGVISLMSNIHQQGALNEVHTIRGHKICRKSKIASNAVLLNMLFYTLQFCATHAEALMASCLQ